jgi:type IV pilus assembly protein PilB
VKKIFGESHVAKLGDMLLKEGLASSDQLEAAAKIQKRDGVPLGAALVQQGVLSEDQLVNVLARQTGYPKFSQDPQSVDASLSKIIPADMAGKYGCAPLIVTGNVLSVGFVEPENERAVDSLAQLTGKTIKSMIVARTDLQTVWKKLYGRSDLNGAGTSQTAARVDAKKNAVPSELLERPGRHPNARYELSREEAAKVVQDMAEKLPEDNKKAEEQVPELTVEPDDSPIVQMVNGLLMEALARRCSDIHIEPYAACVKVRFRVDGELETAHELPPHAAAGVVSRLKVLAGLDIAEKRFPQDGRIKLMIPGKGSIDFRMSTLPSINGEKVVMRVLGTGQLRGSVADLGFRGKAQQHVTEALRNSFGMVLVTGPTGSGKTTTLYTMLKELSDPSVNIVTAEDPVEYNLPNITQVSVKPQIGFTFDVALRSFLRQDPDIILVGEMRDYETAAIAVKAALTGHLVFSTLHTNDAPSTVVRMVDMGIEPYLVASAVKLVIAQRLIRRICTECKEPVEISNEAQEHLHESTLAGIEQTFKGRGCAKCANTGYYGRVPVYEVMPVKSKDLKRVITEGGTEVVVAQVAKREGLRTLKDESLTLVNDGTTSIEEALQIILSE